MTDQSVDSADPDLEARLEREAIQSVESLIKVNGHDKLEDGHFIGVEDFVSDITPPEWLIDGLLQRGYLYGLTAQTNHGKTALAALLSLCIASGRPFAGRDIERGHVLYLCGENPEDFRLRMRAALQVAGLPKGTINNWLTIMPKVDRLAAFTTPIHELAARLPISCIIVDTSMAYYGYNDEDKNVESKLHAQDCRLLIQAPGSPAVLVLCHPIKNANKDELKPRGGSAFLNELDGNLTLWKEEEIIELSHNKLRGPPFDPLQFRLQQCTITGLLDSKGRSVRTVIAESMSESEAQNAQKDHTNSATQALRAMANLPNISITAIATYCDWILPNGQPARSKAQRALNTLSAEGFAIRELGEWKLTEKGRKGAK